jgi:hypothetical protein
MPFLFVAFLATAAGALPSAIHVHAEGDQALRATCYLVEAKGGLIAVDAPSTVTEARALRRTADSLKKPLLAVLLTRAPSGVAQRIAVLAEGQPAPVQVVGSPALLAAAGVAGPTRAVKDNQTIAFSGASFTAHELGPGAAPAATAWVLLEKRPAAFVGDLIVAGMHPRLDHGRTGAWIEQLERAKKLLYGVPRIFPGHGQPAGGAALEQQRRYLASYRAAVAELARGQKQLGGEAKRELAARMEAVLPNALLPSHVGTGADAVAAELASEQR